HLHTEYSLLDGAVRMRELMNEAVKMKMPAVAITDHGNLFGAIDFYQCAKAAGIKPIIGCEAYITSGSYKEKPSRESTFHFTLLAENETGYRNLVKLISAAHLDGFYYRPRIDKNLLASHADGLIGLSGCLASETNSECDMSLNSTLSRPRKCAKSFVIFRRRSPTRWKSPTVAIWKSSSGNRNIPSIRCRQAKRVRVICASFVTRVCTNVTANAQPTIRN